MEGKKSRYIHAIPNLTSNVLINSFDKKDIITTIFVICTDFH